jgi:hypothetical protein
MRLKHLLNNRGAIIRAEVWIATENIYVNHFMFRICVGRKVTLGQNQNTSCAIRLKLMKTLADHLQPAVLRNNVHEPIQLIDSVNLDTKNLTEQVRHIYITFLNLKP